ncbi:MAG: hypothetical protein K9N23_23415 [Akkermansiaceae bacterium]|nr:hypothetical protein [Akkermansiaceae bacterium]
MIEELLKAVSLTASELKTIAAVRKRVEELHEIIHRTRAEHPNRETYNLPPCWLHAERDRLHAELALNPSLELARECASATMAYHNSDRTAGPINGAIAQAVNRESLKLAPVTARILDSARADLAARFKTSVAAVGKVDHLLSGDLAALETRRIQLEGSLLSERAEAARDPLAWLAARELLPATTTTPATAQSDDPANE